MKTPLIRHHYIPEIIQAASGLNGKGKIEKSKSHYTYLNIDNAFILDSFPFLQRLDKNIIMPNYFAGETMGAHITVFYPNECRQIHQTDLGSEHEFRVKNIVSAEIGQKVYYTLLVESPSLLQLRKKYRLPEVLCFKGYAIDLHITIGVKMLLPVSSA